MKRSGWAWGRLAGGFAVLGVLCWQVGTGPFLHGLRSITVESLVWAGLIAVVTTTAAAWRWTLVSRGLGVPMPLGHATAAYYRSQFLNTMLPGGVLGDVHRAIAQGQDVGNVGRGLRAVAWERSAGQVVQVAVALGVLLVLPSPVSSYVPTAAAILVLCLVIVVLGWRALPHSGPTWWRRARHAVTTDLRLGVLATGVWPGVAAASLVVVAGHAATFVLAARTAGVSANTPQLVALAVLVLMAMTIPANVGGWGPREGAAAGLFAAAGLGAAAGVAAATVYGLLVLVATLPGALVLLLGRRPASAVRRQGDPDHAVTDDQFGRLSHR
ncbi:MAG: lysylphosphatidylglycerol synthase transmembrane domain-containing protein [Propionibacteriaceae bacterium]